jgi:membrane protein DedA with SNARE-associated domain
MSDVVFALISQYGVLVVFASTFLSCLALPIPSSLMMLSAGAFVATGDLAITNVLAGAYFGAVLGDQAGYFIGRFGGTPLVERIARSPARKAVLARARALINRYGSLGVFLSTWLTAPLGPWVNFIAGATGLSWARFALWDILGEVVWVALYVGMGYTFASNISEVASTMSNIVGLIAALAVALLAGLWIRSALKSGRDTGSRAPGAQQ